MTTLPQTTDKHRLTQWCYMYLHILLANETPKNSRNINCLNSNSVIRTQELTRGDPSAGQRDYVLAAVALHVLHDTVEVWLLKNLLNLTLGLGVKTDVTLK